MKIRSNAKKLIECDNTFVSPSYTRSYPLVVDRAQGLWIHDVDDNIFLDFTAGIGVNSTGHCHPKIVKAIQIQAAKLIHMSGTDFYYKPQIELAKKLATIYPGKYNKVYFGNSGAEAIESAFKLARYYTKRKLNIAFFGAFHGRTMGALSLTGSKYIQKKNFNPLVPGVTHIPYANCYRCPYNLKYPKCDIQCAHYIEEVFKTTVPAEEVAAIFVEPIQGEGGYIIPPIEFHKILYKIAKKYGILYIADEVQCGMGRTGKMFAMEHFGLIADITSLAKGIASGLPLGAIIAPSEIMNWEPGSHASTFGGNPLSCQASLATIELLENGLIKNAEKQGKYLVKGLIELQSEFECIGDVRGKGLMVAIELVKDRENKERHVALRDAIVDEAFRKGLLLLGCGENSIRFSPSLTVNKNEIDTCLNILREVIKDLLK